VVCRAEACNNTSVTKTTEAPRPATSADVARLAGVSRATVSRILNGDDAPFPAPTRQRVLDSAAKLNYRPSGAARSLARGRSDTIVVLTPDTQFGSHLQDSVDEVAAQARPYSGNVVVRVASGTVQSTLESLLRLSPFVVLNFGVLSSAEAGVLVRRGILVVPEPSDQDPQEAAADPGIARLQGDALRRNGRRPMWYAETTDDRPEPYSRERLAALREYCLTEGLDLPRAVPVALDVEGGKRAVAQILAITDKAAVACYNDGVALTLLAGARELGIAVPEQLAVIGVDDTLAGRLWSPKLTSVHVDMRGFIAELVWQLREQLGTATPRGRSSASLFTLVDGETA
jgi:DNA-binding LacI/PurR family transcriptional regulator